MKEESGGEKKEGRGKNKESDVFIYFSLPTRSTINPRESYYPVWRTITKCFKIY